MNKEERVLKTINREEIDYLPSQITFSDRTRLSKIGKLMGFPQTEDFEDYLQNHIYLPIPQIISRCLTGMMRI